MPIIQVFISLEASFTPQSDALLRLMRQKFDNPGNGSRHGAAARGLQQCNFSNVTKEVTNMSKAAYREATAERQQGQDAQCLVNGKRIVVCVQILESLQRATLEKHIFVWQPGAAR